MTGAVTAAMPSFFNNQNSMLEQHNNSASSAALFALKSEPYVNLDLNGLNSALTFGQPGAAALSYTPKFGTLIPNRIFVGGLPSNTSESELKMFFSTFGVVKDTKIISGDRNGLSKGVYGFVTFENQDVADKIIKNESETLVFKERKLNIGHAIRKQSLFRSGTDLLPGGTLLFTNSSAPTSPLAYAIQSGGMTLLQLAAAANLNQQNSSGQHVDPLAGTSTAALFSQNQAGATSGFPNAAAAAAALMLPAQNAALFLPQVTCAFNGQNGGGGGAGGGTGFDSAAAMQAAAAAQHQSSLWSHNHSSINNHNLMVGHANGAHGNVTPTGSLLALQQAASPFNHSPTWRIGGQTISGNQLQALCANQSNNQLTPATAAAAAYLYNAYPSTGELMYFQNHHQHNSACNQNMPFNNGLSPNNLAFHCNLNCGTGCNNGGSNAVLGIGNTIANGCLGVPGNGNGSSNCMMNLNQSNSDYSGGGGGSNSSAENSNNNIFDSTNDPDESIMSQSPNRSCNGNAISSNQPTTSVSLQSTATEQTNACCSPNNNASPNNVLSNSANNGLFSFGSSGNPVLQFANQSKKMFSKQSGLISYQCEL